MVDWLIPKVTTVEKDGGWPEAGVVVRGSFMPGLDFILSVLGRDLRYMSWAHV